MSLRGGRWGLSRSRVGFNQTMKMHKVLYVPPDTS
jgi:hypothetical protein